MAQRPPIFISANENKTVHDCGRIMPKSWTMVSLMMAYQEV